MRRPVILAVDDDRAVLGAVVADLRARYADRYRILGVESGQQALDTLQELRLRNEPLALLVVDQRMPGMTGMEFLEQATAMFPDAKRALLTAYADTEAAIRAVNSGVDHYLLKPWDPPDERFYPVLDDLLETWRPPAPSSDLRIVGTRWSAPSHALQKFLARNLVPYRWLDIATDPEAERLLDAAGLSAAQLPVLLLGDGSALVQPETTEVATRIGLHVHSDREAYELVVIGAGPAGLAAGLYGASEGLSTLVADSTAIGGQAGTTSRIENYLGFPVGLSGTELTMRARQQVIRFGAEVLVPQEAVRLERADPYTLVTFADGKVVTASALVVATGVAYRLLEAPGVQQLTGAGIYYSAGRVEAVEHAGGRLFIVGGGNSAGQAALFLSESAERVTMVVRRGTLDATMSRYLIDQIATTSNVDVRYRTEVVEAKGEDHLETLTLRDSDTGTEQVPADALFVFIGMAPRTEWVSDVLRRDEQGFILVGPDLGQPPVGWPLERSPMTLETSVPGVFAAGDVRHGSIKRVASAVGAGAMAVRFVHDWLSSR
jgi:thioredoxin reductase (NADPH)